jgi:hypothetical protein
MAEQGVPVLVLVGGFLGAGKTTLILKAAQLLARRGVRVATILNDQDEGLVDTRFAAAQAVVAEEVAGGCFCCRFSDLVEATERLRAQDPDVIFAEPVGSCIDISATVVHPLKALQRGRLRVAPLTVLVDPRLAADVFAGRAGEDVSYLFHNQLAEADILCAGKSDVAGQALDLDVDFRVSAKSGDGVEEWLEEVLSGRRVAGARRLTVDYSRYAEAEAALGWLNLHAEVKLRWALSPSMVAGPLLDELDGALTAAGVRIAHLKVFDEAATGYVKASVCVNGAEPEPDGDLLADAAMRHELVINLRAEGEPATLRAIVEAALKSIAGDVAISHLESFRPLPPKPEHR